MLQTATSMIFDRRYARRHPNDVLFLLLSISQLTLHINLRSLWHLPLSSSTDQSTDESKLFCRLPNMCDCVHTTFRNWNVFIQLKTNDFRWRECKASCCAHCLVHFFQLSSAISFASIWITAYTLRESFVKYWIFNAHRPSITRQWQIRFRIRFNKTQSNNNHFSILFLLLMQLTIFELWNLQEPRAVFLDQKNNERNIFRVNKTYARAVVACFLKIKSCSLYSPCFSTCSHWSTTTCLMR